MAADRPYIRPAALMSWVVNPIVRRLGLSPILVVRGRRTGRSIEVPIGQPFALDGRRYLVSGRGNTHWVRNLRAAGVGEIRSRGSSDRFVALEVDGPEREHVVAAYRARLGRAVDPYFRQIPDPADHPVFRIDSPSGEPA